MVVAMFDWTPENRTTVGKILILTAVMFFLYRNNLNSLNNLILSALVIWGISSLMMRTKMFTKKENQRFRRTKVLSATIAILVALMMSVVAIGLMVIDEFGAPSQVYDSPNYYDESFQNLEQVSVEGDGFFSTLGDFLVFDPSREPNAIIPTEKFEPDNLQPGEVSITWFGHSTILIQSAEYNILIDPLFGDDSMGPLFLGPAPFDYENSYEVEDLPQIDIILISHDHYDHLDMRTVIEFDNSQFLVPLGVKPHLELWDLPSENIEEFDWYEGTNISDDLEIILTPSQHFSGRGLDRDNTLWGSWVIKLGDHSIFFGGDGGYFSEFKEIGERHGPFDIAILEAGQYNAAWSDIHMFPHQAVQASIDLKADAVMPIHNSKYILALHPWDEPLIEVTAEGAKKNQPVATPVIGQSFMLGLEYPNHPWWEDVKPGKEPFMKSNIFAGMLIPIEIVAGVLLIRDARENSDTEEE